MSGTERFMLYLAMLFSMIAGIAINEYAVIGAPPRHCQYLVPVKAHPGVLRCSEYPGTNK